ncbi:MAG: efflux RND transporter permease subunit [Eggerthellaceae bacterium]|jgi:predicted RND superfamily exporter protein
MANIDKRRMARYRYGKWAVKWRKVIIVVALLSLIPCTWQYMQLKCNYDLLSYLPDSIETVQGQNILKDEFGKGAFSFVITEGLSDQENADLKSKIEQVDHVDTVLWADDLANSNVPQQILPEKYYNAFHNGDATMMAVFFDTGTSEDATLLAVDQIRNISDQEVMVSGMSAFVDDLKTIAQREEPIYVLVAVIGAVIGLLLLTDSFLVPFVFLASIGIAIMWNMGTNFMFGEISYVTKALAAVLQLAVTMDYSIFLWHAFVEEREKIPDNPNEAMARALANTLTALTSSAATATAGFLALIFMSYTLGLDLGLVMAKGCLLGLLGSITTLPALILAFQKPLLKTRHKTLIPNAKRLGAHVTRRWPVYLVIFAVLLVPAVYGYMNKPVFYDFTKMVAGSSDTMSAEDTKFLTANEALKDNFDVSTTEMILCKSDMPHAQAKEMLNRINAVDGVKYAIGYDSIVGGQIPSQAVPDKVKSALVSGDYQLIVINSAYAVSSTEGDAQIDTINSILQEYDSDGMLIGEAPATKDLISLTDVDFHRVDWIAIIGVAIILLIVFRSITLPVILVFVIEFAIMFNLSIQFYMNDAMPFLTPICISTIQLGSTVNYAILQTTRYRRERFNGREKEDAISTAMATSLPAVVTSACSFFSATIGISIYSNVTLISSMTTLMARGALISMFVTLFILPAFFMLLDGVIIRTSRHFINRGESSFNPDDINFGNDSSSAKAFAPLNAMITSPALAGGATGILGGKKASLIGRGARRARRASACTDCRQLSPRESSGQVMS